MLRALPFQTIGDIARHGLELHVYCPRCYSTRRLVDLGPWADRCFATARFRCTGTRYDGKPCRAIGMPVVRPAELLPVGGPVTLAFLTCPRCIWELFKPSSTSRHGPAAPNTIAAPAAAARLTGSPSGRPAPGSTGLLGCARRAFSADELCFRVRAPFFPATRDRSNRGSESADGRQSPPHSMALSCG